METTILAYCTITPRGDGSYTLRPMAPKAWLSIREAARVSGASRRTIIRWARTGYVTARRRGPKLWEVAADSLPGGKDPAR
jgi:hypothetical protein